MKKWQEYVLRGTFHLIVGAVMIFAGLLHFSQASSFFLDLLYGFLMVGGVYSLLRSFAYFNWVYLYSRKVIAERKLADITKQKADIDARLMEIKKGLQAFNEERKEE